MADLIAAMSVADVTEDSVSDRVIDFLLFIDRDRKALTSESLKALTEATLGTARRAVLVQLLTKHAGVKPDHIDVVVNHLLRVRKGLEERTRGRPKLAETGAAGRPEGKGKFEALISTAATGMMILDGAARKTASRDASLLAAGRETNASSRERLDTASKGDDDYPIRGSARRVESRLKSKGQTFVQMVADQRLAIETDERLRAGFQLGQADVLSRLPDKES